MVKWSDYCISKASKNSNSERFSEFYIYQDGGDSLSDGTVRDRNWVIQKLETGKSFSTVAPSEKTGRWNKISDVKCDDGRIKLGTDILPLQITKRKTFLSYYHHDDQNYKEYFENRFGDLMVNKSVADGDIDAENSTSYIKQLIQRNFLSDTTVMVVLIGKNTLCRKHVDWEISGALNLKVGDHYSGLIGILLPTHPDFGKAKYDPSTIPPRLADNAKSGYAKIYDWTLNRRTVQSWLEDAYAGRSDRSVHRVNSRAQMQKNTCK